jgi:hypothetical protein
MPVDKTSRQRKIELCASKDKIATESTEKDKHKGKDEGRIIFERMGTKTR